MQKQNKVVQEMTLQQCTKDQIEKSLHHKFGKQSMNRSIARDLNTQSSTIHRYLTEVLHLKYKLTRWLLHVLLDAQMKNRVDQANDLYNILEKSKHIGYRNIITGDQTWMLMKTY